MEASEKARSPASLGGTGRRDEFTFGDFHQTVIVSGDNLADTRTTPVPPPEIRQVRKYLPIALGVFDEEDIIRSIEPGEVVGRAAKCINFDTHFRQHTAGEPDLCGWRDRYPAPVAGRRRAG